MSSRTTAKKPIASASQKFFQSVAPLSDLSAEKYGNPRPFPVDLHGVHQTNARLNPHDANPYLLTVKQAAERLQLGVNCVYGLAKAEHDPIPDPYRRAQHPHPGRRARTLARGADPWLASTAQHRKSR